MWQNTKLTELLNIASPIIQGPFGGGASSVELATTVCEAGGLGSFGANHLHGPQIKDVANAFRQKTQKPFALNLWIPFKDSENPTISDAEFAENCQLLKPYFDELNLPLPTRPKSFWPEYRDQIEAVLEAKPAAFSFVFGIPEKDILSRCKHLKITTIGTATTVAEAIALDQAGIDIIVASGFEAGGHRTSFLKNAEDSLMGTMALIPQVVNAVKAPVVAAGGVADGRGIAAALALGATGVQIGTAFLACDESAANAVHKKALWGSDKYTALTRAFSGRLARGIDNRIMQDLKANEAKLPRYPIQNWFMSQLRSTAVAQDRADLISLWCGQAAPLLRHHKAATLLKSLVDETTMTIKSLANGMTT